MSKDNLNGWTDEEIRDAHDYDADAPRGNDPVIRRDGGIEWFRYMGCWWQAGTLSRFPEIREAYLREKIKRERAEKGGQP